MTAALLYTVAETAKMLAVSSKTVQRMLGDGRLVAHRFNHNFVRVDGSSVMRLLAVDPTAMGADVKNNNRAITPERTREIRYNVYFEKDRGYIVRYYDSSGKRRSHRLEVPVDASREDAETAAAGWIAANVEPSEPKRRAAPRSIFGPTFEQFARQWIEGELHRRWPDHVKLKASAKDDKGRLERYVFPVIGSEPIASFDGDHGLDLAERVIAALPTGDDAISPSTRRQVLQVMRRVLNLACYPARLIRSNPLPRGFVPQSKTDRAKSYLFPSEDAKLMGCTQAPLLWRLFFGVLAREGLRVSEALSLIWADLDLDHGVVCLDENKTEDPRTWALDPGVAEALRRWRVRLGAKAKPNQPVFIEVSGSGIDGYEAARTLREYLQLAGVTRPQLFERSDKRIAIRAHDLRATFVTVNLALGKSEAWITDRTGHQSSEMIYTYKRAARMHQELALGAFTPLHEAIPELRDLEARAGNTRVIPN
ncbi:MAG: tyrosine-type recombinase/integrase [Polyangiaceae bacterium]